jgi:TPP-dependent pyruvate/acetoin dehydrogenase alpha subunit
MYNFSNDLKKLSSSKLKSKFKNPKLNKSILKKFYVEMLKIRKVETEIANLAKMKIINTPVHLSVGQEAIAVSITSNLKKDDQVFGNHRSHSHIIAKGVKLNSFISECFGKVTGVSKGFGGSMHLIDKQNGFQGSVPIVGATIPIACGYALSQKLNKKKNISVVFFGDGACEEGVFHETLNFASTYNIPILFVIENNLFSSHLDINLRQPSNKLSRFANANNIRASVFDGNNVLTGYQESKKAIKFIKDTGKPFILEAITFRHLGHVGPNKDVDVGVKRNSKELNSWIENRDPLKNYEKFLFKNKIIDEKFLKKINNSLNKEIKRAINFAKSSSYPSKKMLNKYVLDEKN